MPTKIQTIIALTIVGITAIWLVFRALAIRKKPGCGGACACPASAIKTKRGPDHPAV